jgi:small subunit ribosomal protein S9
MADTKPTKKSDAAKPEAKAESKAAAPDTAGAPAAPAKPARAPKPAPVIPAPTITAAAIPAPAIPAPAIPAPSIGSTPGAAERPLSAPKPAKGGWWWGVGRRKTAVARVRIKPATGEGKVQVHTVKKGVFKSIEQYFAEDRDRADAISPLKATNTLGKLEVFIRLDGGGYMGQAQAAMLALARALKDYDPAVEPALRQHGMLTRDARDVERKKYGQAGARRRFQFSKR